MSLSFPLKIAVFVSLGLKLGEGTGGITGVNEEDEGANEKNLTGNGNINRINGNKRSSRARTRLHK